MVFLVFLLLSAGALLWLFLVTRMKTGAIERRFPPIGTVKTVNGLAVHYVDRPAKGDPDAPVVVFLHGASGNLRDPFYGYGGRLNGRVRQIFIDRPGHGWSERGGDEMASPAGQARHILAFLDLLGIERAIFVGHSWGGALAVTMGVLFPERVSGLLLSAPVSHPWPGGINWYYPFAARAVIGRLFANTLALPVGARQIACATDKVFWPNPVPDYYVEHAGGEMVLVPKRFRANALDVARLRDHLVAISPRYPEITAPVTLITGDRDQIVLPWVHSDGLERDIAGLRRIDLKKTGHMPHHAEPDLFAAEILRLAEKAAASPARSGKTAKLRPAAAE